VEYPVLAQVLQAPQVQGQYLGHPDYRLVVVEDLLHHHLLVLREAAPYFARLLSVSLSLFLFLFLFHFHFLLLSYHYHSAFSLDF
jgi:hypothetical protein